MALKCPNNKIKACNKFLQCEIAYPCEYRGKQMISGVMSVIGPFTALATRGRGFRLPILPVRIYTLG